MKFLLIGVLPSSITNFRGDLIRAITREGHEVVVMSSGANQLDLKKIESLGVKHINYTVRRNSLSPISDIRTCLELKKVIADECPDIVLAYTIKPIIWGGIASAAVGNINFYGLVTGLGYAFQKSNLKRRLLSSIVKLLYKNALRNSAGVIFQNPDDRYVFIKNSILKRNKSFLVNGSGVDLEQFAPKPLPKETKFLLIARLLGEKGIREYAKAAEIIKAKYPSVEFHLVGPTDPSPDGIPQEEVLKWQTGAIEYHGSTRDVRPFIEATSIFVLPSYHEGLPRTILEAMATGRPILTTDVPGCRETVINGENGWLVEKANVEQLVERMIWFIENQHKWQEMANASRAIVEDKFDVHKVNANLLKIMELDK